MSENNSAVLHDMTSPYAMINVCGPASRKLLEKVSHDNVSNENFEFGQCRQIALGYSRALALRMSYVGELVYELYISTEYASYAYELLWKEGQELGVINAGHRAIESLRLEKGYRT